MLKKVDLPDCHGPTTIRNCSGAPHSARQELPQECGNVGLKVRCDSVEGGVCRVRLVDHVCGARDEVFATFGAR